MIVIVTGMERSGTSMMMRILEKGGYPVVYDDSREPDENNPCGYFELYGGKIIKALMNEEVDMKNFKDKALKITSIGIEYLPSDQDYKLIYMERDPEEVALSTEKMGNIKVSSEDIRAENERLRSFAKENYKTLVVAYQDVLRDPEPVIREVSDWVGELDISEAVKAVDTRLYRNRCKKGN